MIQSISRIRWGRSARECEQSERFPLEVNVIHCLTEGQKIIWRPSLNLFRKWPDHFCITLELILAWMYGLSKAHVHMRSKMHYTPKAEQTPVQSSLTLAVVTVFTTLGSPLMLASFAGARTSREGQVTPMSEIWERESG